MAAIAKNAAIDKARLKGFQYQKKTKTLENDVHYHKVVHHNALGIDVERLLGPLDEKYKIVLDYLYLKGYSQSEAAEALGIPLGTIKTRLRKAISILRDELKNEKKLFLGLLIIAGILLLI
jgi:RNA polymerase sigma-70 factor (ECF subfamily)